MSAVAQRAKAEGVIRRCGGYNGGSMIRPPQRAGALGESCTFFPQKPLVDGVILGGKAAKDDFTQRRWVACKIPHFRDGDSSRQLNRITESPRADRWNLPVPVFADHAAPYRITLRTQRLFSNFGIPCSGRQYHDELEFRIDEDRLAVDTQQRKPSLLARKNPELIAVSKIRRGAPRSESIGLPMPIGRFEQILFRHDLPGADRAVISQQHAKTPVVAQDGIETSRADFEAIAGPDPGGIGLRAIGCHSRSVRYSLSVVPVTARSSTARTTVSLEA